MSRRRLKPVGLGMRLVRSQPGLTLALVLAAAVPAAANAIGAGIVGTYYGTLADGVREDNAGESYRLQGDPGDGAPALSAADVFPVWVQPQAQARTGDRAAPVTLVTSPAAPHMQHLVSGQRPSRDGEATLSASLAERLRVRVGDVVSVQTQGTAPSDLRVTGLTTSVIRPRELSVLQAGSITTAGPSSWVTSRDLNDRGLLRAVESRQLQVRTGAALASELQDSDENSVIRGLRLSPAFFYLVTVALLLSLLVVARRRVAVALRGLEAAGLGPRHLATVVATAAGLLTATGLALGLIAGWIVLAVAARPLGAAFGQLWITGKPTPGASPIGYIIAVTLSVTVAAAVAATRYSPRTASAPTRPPRLRTVLAAGAIAAAAVLCYLIPRPAVGSNLLGAFAGGAALTLLTPFLVTAIQARRRTARGSEARATARVVASSGRTFTTTAGALGMLAYIAAGYSAFLGNDVAFGERNYMATQPVGSLVVREANTKDLDVVAAVATGEGRRPEIFPDPDERASHVRVASVKYARCLQGLASRRLSAADGVCDNGVTSTAPINGVALIPRGQPVLGEAVDSVELLADPSLILDGQVALLSFGAAPDQVVGIRMEPARPAVGLGGILPGAVIRGGSPLAASLALTPSSKGTLVIPRVAELGEESRARIDGVIAQVAGVGFVDRDNGYQDRGSSALSLFLGIGGAIVVGAVMVTALVAFAISQAATRDLLVSFGAQPRKLYRLALRSFAVPVVTVVTASVLGLATAADVGAPGLPQYGYFWLTPAVTAVAAAIVAAVQYARTDADGLR